jgi:hypothetical protein
MLTEFFAGCAESARRAFNLNLRVKAIRERRSIGSKRNTSPGIDEVSPDWKPLDHQYRVGLEGRDNRAQ